MLKLNVYSKDGNIVGEYTLPIDIFGIKPNDGAIYEAIRMYQANKRQGTASTKTRGEVRGGGRKPWVQKHTGRARAGSIRSPLWPGGGIVFGPKPRNYYYKIPRKKLRLALLSALSYKTMEGKILLLDKLDFTEQKTKLFNAMLGALGLNSKKSILFVSSNLKREDNFYKAGRNIKGVEFKNANDLNALDVLSTDILVFPLDALKSFLEIKR
ncbi:MAG: 50S ribosomal protein L4 [bacterium]|nr:50S ribosomal protein L4 [bacterium]